MGLGAKSNIMGLEEKPNFYDILDIGPDVSQKEIRGAYIRLKATFGKNNIALYSIMSREETQEVMKRIEEAYRILSDPTKRRKYDLNHGIIRRDQVEHPVSPFHGDDISVKKKPPKILNNREPVSPDDLLNPPTTDFSEDGVAESDTFEERSTTTSPPDPFNEPKTPDSVPPDEDGITETTKDKINTTEIAIEKEEEWRGDFIRKIREIRNVSIEELSENTKISKRYLKAIENEDYKALPAAVFLRGFVIQVAKELKLPHDKVAAAYMNRFKEFQLEKS